MSSRKENEHDVLKTSPTSSDDVQESPRALRVMPTQNKAEIINHEHIVKELSGQALNDTESTISPALPSKNGKKKKKTKPRIAKSQGIRGSRGVDTLLRNAYRAQLDMLALAATKANIMISLNGLLMSMLIISGTHLVSINGLYIIPIAIFLITCAAATTFAVFAARPEISRNKYHYHDFVRDEAHLLSFEEFSDLRESEYVEAMSEMLEDSQRVYRNMIAHVHELGVTADRKYRNLYYSYNAFMAGTIVTVLSLLVLVGMRWSGVTIPV